MVRAPNLAASSTIVGFDGPHQASLHPSRYIDAISKIAAAMDACSGPISTSTNLARFFLLICSKRGSRDEVTSSGVALESGLINQVRTTSPGAEPNFAEWRTARYSDSGL